MFIQVIVSVLSSDVRCCFHASHSFVLVFEHAVLVQHFGSSARAFTRLFGGGGRGGGGGGFRREKVGVTDRLVKVQLPC